MVTRLTLALFGRRNDSIVLWEFYIAILARGRLPMNSHYMDAGLIVNMSKGECCGKVGHIGCRLLRIEFMRFFLYDFQVTSR